MSKLEEIVKRVQDERAKQEAQDPSSPEAKRGVRIAGLVFCAFGLAFAIPSYLMYVKGEIWPFGILGGLGFIVFGLYVAVVGKMPKKK